MWEDLPAVVYRFLPVLVRMSGAIVATPVFNRPGVPSRLKIGLGVWLAAVIYPFTGAGGMEYGSWQEYAIVLAGELAVGLSLGFVVTLVFSAMYLAGQLMDVPMGFGMVNIFDPNTSAQVPILAQFQYVLAILVFLSINGHHELVRALVESFRTVPVGGVRFSGATAETISRIFSSMFVLGFKLSLPVAGALFLTDVALGIVARTVPQINVFILGFPAKIVVGFVVLVFFLPAYVALLSAVFGKGGELTSSLVRFMSSLSAGGVGP